MTAMPFVELRRSDDDRVVAGVCAGIADTIGVDPTLVRLFFTLLALAAGAGVVLYVAVWLYMSGRGWLALIGLLAASGLALGAIGLSAHASIALVLIACGLVAIWRQRRLAADERAGLARRSRGCHVRRSAPARPGLGRVVPRPGRDRRRAPADRRPLAVAARGRARRRAYGAHPQRGAGRGRRARARLRAPDAGAHPAACRRAAARRLARAPPGARAPELALRPRRRVERHARGRPRRRSDGDRGGARRSASSSHRAATARWTTTCAPSCSRRARRCRTPPSSPASRRSPSTPSATRSA